MDIVAVISIVSWIGGLALSIFAIAKSDVEFGEVGVILICLGVEFGLLYLIHEGVLEMGIFALFLCLCAASVIAFTVIKGLVPRRL